jgi:hypothetical protein
MALTKPKLSQNIDTDVSVFSDPILVLHQGSTSANLDVGFLMNRSNGLTSNAAVIWQESTRSFVYILTNDSGASNSNLNVLSYANVTVGNITSNVLYTYEGIRWAGNGNVFASGGGGGITYTASATAPLSPTIGDQWYDTGTDILFEYIDDGDDVYWVDINSPTLYTNNIVTGTSLSITGNATVNDTMTAGNIRTNGIYWSANGIPITSTTGGLPIDFGFVTDPVASLNSQINFGTVI